jgi:hypothetical protein
MHSVRRALDHHVVRVHGHDESFDMDREAARGSQPLCGPGGFVPAVADVGLAVSVDEERVPTDPDLGSGMVFGVHGEDPARSDHDMVDVGSAVANRNRVKEPPPRVLLRDLLQLGGDLLLAVGADSPRTLVRLHTERPREKSLHRCGFASGQRLLARLGSGPVGREVDPGAGDVTRQLSRGRWLEDRLGWKCRRDDSR